MGLGGPRASGTRPCCGRGWNERIFKIPPTPNPPGSLCEPKGSITTPCSRGAQVEHLCSQEEDHPVPPSCCPHRHTQTGTFLLLETNKTCISHSCSPGLCCNSFGNTSQGPTFWAKLQRPPFTRASSLSARCALVNPPHLQSPFLPWQDWVPDDLGTWEEVVTRAGDTGKGTGC